MKGILIAVCFFLSTSLLMAQNSIREFPCHNITVSYGISKMCSNNSRMFFDNINNIVRADHSLDLEIDYEYVWKNGWGLGLNLSQSHLDDYHYCNNIFYFGPCATYNYLLGKRMNLFVSSGCGLSMNDFDEGSERNGLGILNKMGIKYSFTKHLGAVLDLSSFFSIYTEKEIYPDNLDADYVETLRCFNNGVSLGFFWNF